MRSSILTLAAVLLFSRAAIAATQAPPADRPPMAPVYPVTTNYFGTEVVDPYRYMETLDDPIVQNWMKAQADFTRGQLDALPGRAGLLKRIRELDNASRLIYYLTKRGDRVFYMLDEPGSPIGKLVYRDGLKGKEHVLVDPAKLARRGTHYALDFYFPSWDGRRVAYGLSAGGSEESVLHVIEVDGGKVDAESIPRTNDSIVSWRPDNRSFFYTRYAPVLPTTPPAERLYNARTYLHRLGQSADGAADPAVFGRGVSSDVEVPEGQMTYVLCSPDSGYAVAIANHNQDNNPSTLYLAPLDAVAGPQTHWQRLAGVEEEINSIVPHGDQLYWLSSRGAPRFRLLTTSAQHPDVAHPTVLVPESEGVLTSFSMARDGLYVRRLDGTRSHLVQLSWDGKQSQVVDTPYEGLIGDAIADPQTSGILFKLQGWLQSPEVFQLEADFHQVRNSGLLAPSMLDTSAFVATETMVTGHDGTRIPLSILHRKDLALDGSHPTILTGYGSYGVSLEPGFDPTALGWLERGGVLAIAHIRGGGELGEDWHQQGRLQLKLNTVLDFISCAQALIDRRYTSTRFLAGDGGSAGGITVGGAMVWQPDLFGVILDEVGMSDTLRSETEPNGPPNISEMGSVTTEAGFHALYLTSAYAHVRDGVAYPSVLFTTGANDPRVAPWQMAKIAARVQAATSSGRPVLLRVDYDAGHGIGSSRAQQQEYLADLWSFALWQMGDSGFQPGVVRH